MKKFRGTYMTKEQYIEWLISNIKIDAKHFAEAHYPELKMYFSDLISRNQSELVSLGFTWEQVEQIEIEAYKTVQSGLVPLL